MLTYIRLHLQTLGSQPVMPKNLPDHWRLSHKRVNLWMNLWKLIYVLFIPRKPTDLPNLIINQDGQGAAVTESPKLLLNLADHNSLSELFSLKINRRLSCSSSKNSLGWSRNVQRVNHFSIDFKSSVESLIPVYRTYQEQHRFNSSNFQLR